MANTVAWLKQEWVCEVNEHGANWSEVPGIYLFAGLNSAGKWYPLYVGQAKSLADRIPTHDKWQAARHLGATHVHAMVVQDEAMRCAIEEALIRAYQPQLNVQLRGV